MNTSNSSSRSILLLIGIGLLVVAILFACFRNNDSAAAPTRTPAPTNSPAPGKTSLPTNTALSTNTVKPANPPPTKTPLPTNIPASTPNPIQNILWQWTSLTDQSTNETTAVPLPADYTISFYPDGTLSGKADCNTFSGTYSQQNGFKIRIGGVSSAACADGSLGQQYLDLLNSVVAGGPDGSGALALETAGGAQRMLFLNGGATVQP